MKTILVVLALMLSSFYTIPFNEKDVLWQEINATRQDPTIFSLMKKDKTPAVGTLKRDALLDSVAQAHADILATKNVLYHVSHDYSECCAYTLKDDSSGPLGAWITSTAGHKEAVMGRQFTKIGIGVARSWNKVYYVIELN